MKKTKFKEFYSKIKELWSIPRYKAIIKLSLYGLMFLLIIVMSNIYSEHSTENNNIDKSKSYTEIVKSIDLQNSEINYSLKTATKEYKLEGKVESNIISGYLDDSTTINKIKIKDNNIYVIKNNEENIYTDTDSLNTYLLIPENIINLVQDESAYINKTKEETTYIFNITYNNINYEVEIVTNLESITKIKIKNDQIEYTLQFDFDKKA